MARELSPLDLTRLPDLLHLAEEVCNTRLPRRLRRGDEDIAMLVPATPRRRRRIAGTLSNADIDAFLASAGSWKDVDTDALVAGIYESRRSSRPPVQL